MNLDSHPASPDILAHDLHEALPFPDGRFDAIFASHVLEHLEPDAGLSLLRECNRILKYNGILRVVVPDLEEIVRLYLESLAAAERDDRDAASRYDWVMLELYDQTVRVVPGGRMGAYLGAQSLGEEQARFIRSRIGEEGLDRGASSLPMRPAPIGWRALRRARAISRATRRLAAKVFVFLFLGRAGLAALEEGLFRRGGEVHRWMYDRYSLSRALQRSGFVDVQVRRAGESLIADFDRYALESCNGRPRKPDSIYVEARKLGP